MDPSTRADPGVPCAVAAGARMGSRPLAACPLASARGRSCYAYDTSVADSQALGVALRAARTGGQVALARLGKSDYMRWKSDRDVVSSSMAGPCAACSASWKTRSPNTCTGLARSQGVPEFRPGSCHPEQAQRCDLAQSIRDVR